MNFKSTILAVALIASAHAQQPSAQQILEGARISATLTRLDEGLSGNLRKGNSNTPITLFLKGKDIQFQFSENKGPWRIFHMRIGDEAFNLFEIADGKTAKFPAEKIVEPIAGTDLTYEDLALRFFYWPDPKLEATEDVGGQFAEEARKMHYGETPERAIRGQVSREETSALIEEGIQVMPLPMPAAIKGPVQ